MLVFILRRLSGGKAFATLAQCLIHAASNALSSTTAVDLMAPRINLLHPPSLSELAELLQSLSRPR
jgi:hypothetical protein